jgi:hypothetical protein
MTAGAGGVWLLDDDAGTVTLIDPETRTVGASIGVGSGATSITAAFGSVWVTLPTDGDLARIDPLTDDVERIHVGAAPVYAAEDQQRGWLWLIRRTALGGPRRRAPRWVPRMKPLFATANSHIERRWRSAWTSPNVPAHEPPATRGVRPQHAASAHSRKHLASV